MAICGREGLGMAEGREIQTPFVLWARVQRHDEEVVGRDCGGSGRKGERVIFQMNPGGDGT